MANLFEIQPQKIEVGMPITVTVPASQLQADQRFVTVFQSGGDPITTPLFPAPDGKWFSQFALYEPGEYQLQLGSHEVSFVVLPQKNIGFLFEIGMVSLSVFVFLGGLILWSWKNQKREVGSFSQPGPS